MKQKDKVIARIKEVGYVDNFWSISTKTSLRLGAIIFELKQEGWDFHGEFRYTNGSEKNFHYIPIKVPPEHSLSGDSRQPAMIA